MTIRIEDRPRRQPPTALDTALRATALDELDERIGEAAVAGYEETVTRAALGASETILAWWRAQPPDVVEAFLDELRERDENAIVHVEELTETSGIELLGELLRDAGEGNGRQTYERAMRRKLDAIRAENAVPADSETPALDAALATLDERTIAHELGVGATIEYATRIARAEHEAGLEIVRRWRRRPKGRDAIIELVAELENTQPEEVENATPTSRGGPDNDLVAILGDETTRELYERLATRLAAAKPDTTK